MTVPILVAVKPPLALSQHIISQIGCLRTLHIIPLFLPVVIQHINGRAGGLRGVEGVPLEC